MVVLCSWNAAACYQAYGYERHAVDEGLGNNVFDVVLVCGDPHLVLKYN